MKFGLLLNTQAPLEEDIRGLFDRLLEQVATAREAGFDLVLAPQHYLVDYSQLQPVPLLSRLAAEAGSMRVGTGILILPLHHPVEVAEHLATLDVISSGVVAGVGAGYRDVEFDTFGVPKAERGGRIREGVELLDRLWTEEEVTYDGEFYSTDGVTINPRPAEKPPVWIGANSRAAIERAARVGDAWYVNPHSTIDEIREHKRRYDEIREKRGLSTAVPLRREVFVESTTEAAVAAGRTYLEEKYRRYVQWGQNEAMERPGDLSVPFEELAADRFLLGTPAEVCESIERYEHELNASHFVVRVHWPGMPFDRSIECIERLGDEVIPNV